MAKRYELPDAAWELIADLISPEQRMGRPRSDDRLMLNGIFWILCSGAAWCDLPERLGPWSTVYQRFRDWRDDGTFPGKQGRPRKRCRWLLADKGYDAEHLRQYCDRYRMQPVIPLRTMKRKPKPGLPRLFDRPKYRQRNIIERMFGWLKESRRIGTRYDKLARSFAAMVTLACTLRCLRQYFSYRT